MKNRKGQLGYSISLKEALRQGGFYNKDGIWNSLLKMDGHILRGRVETIVIKKEEQQMFAHIKDYRKKRYRIPGGSFENGVPNIKQAENEVHEEARMRIKNIINTCQHYIRLYPNPPEYTKNECLDWEGNYTEVYVAEYDGPYEEYVRKMDRDDDMYQKGRFYDINYIYPILSDTHKSIIDEIFPDRRNVTMESPIMILGTEDANRRIYPYYTPIEMNNLGVFNEISNRYSNIEDEAIDWYHEYVDTLQNPDSENWYKELQYRYENYKKDPTLENKQLILNLGWNPEVQVTFENVLRASKETEKRLVSKEDICIKENYLFSTKDIILNLKDFESGKFNILFVTGLSGSGKTTMTNQLCETYDAIHMNLDIFQSYANINGQYEDEDSYMYEIVEDYFDKHKDIDYFSLDITSEKFEGIFIPFLKELITILRKDKQHKYIIEGIHIMLFMKYKEVKKYPLICVNTSMFKSMIRHWTRDNWGYREMIKYGINDIKRYTGWENRYGVFKDPIQEIKITTFHPTEEEKKILSLNLKYAIGGIDLKRDNIKNKILLSELKTLSLDNKNLNIIKSSHPDDYMDLIDILPKCDGRIYTDNGKFVALVALYKDNKHIVKILIGNDYKFKGLYKQLLEILVLDFSARTILCQAKSAYVYKVANELGFSFIEAQDGAFLMRQTKISNTASSGDSKPIFIINTFGGLFDKEEYSAVDKAKTFVPTMIASATRSMWSHSILSLTPDLSEMYSFGKAGEGKDRRMGFVKHGMKELTKNNKITPMEILCMYVPTAKYNKLKKIIKDEYIDHQQETEYDVMGLFRILSGHINQKVDPRVRVCSTFVAQVLKKADISILSSEIELTSPVILSHLAKNPAVLRIYYGTANRLDVKKIVEYSSKFKGRIQILDE